MHYLGQPQDTLSELTSRLVRIQDEEDPSLAGFLSVFVEFFLLGKPDNHPAS